MSTQKTKHLSEKQNAAEPQDKRSRKIVVLAHCILNQNARVSGLARYPAIIEEIVELLQKCNVGLLQMPCPELVYAGARRPGKTRDEYDTPGYRRHCRRIALTIVNQLEELGKNEVRVLAVLGVKGSPSCDVGSSAAETGILIGELHAELRRRGLKTSLHAVNPSSIAADVAWLRRRLTRA